MKKTVPLLLIAAMSAVCLASCTSKATPQHEISDYDTVSAVTPESNEINGEISVKNKKYSYNGTDLVVLDVQNNTDKNLVITVNGTYLDKDGNTIQTGTKSFEQFYAGCRNYFLFDPKINFDSFSYTVESEITNEDCFVKNVVVQALEPYQGRDEDNPALLSGIGVSNGNDFTVTLGASVIFFNEKGDIVYTVHKTDPYTKNPTHPEFTSAYEEWNQFYLYTDTEHELGNLHLPEHLEGKLTSIICVDIIEKTEVE